MIPVKQTAYKLSPTKKLLAASVPACPESQKMRGDKLTIVDPGDDRSADSDTPADIEV